MKLQKFDLSKTWPVEAKCPVPLSAVLKAYKKSLLAPQKEAMFEKEVLAVIPEKAKNICGDLFGDLPSALKTLYATLQKLSDFRITANVLGHQVIEDEDSQQMDDNTSSLEHLFTRLNTMGTKITPYDLRYSAIKAYWGDIKDSNDAVAGQIMPPAHLAILVFRLAITQASINAKKVPSVESIPSVAKIRSLGQNRKEESEVCKIVSYYYDKNGEALRELIASIDNALGVYCKNEASDGDGLPPFLRTSIVMRSPDVYLMLMYLAHNKRLNEFNIFGLATWIHWFSSGDKKKIVDFLLGCFDSAKTLKEGLSEVCEKKWLVYPILATADNFDFDEFSETWRRESYTGKEWWPLFCIVSLNRELLIFAQRVYFNQVFDYDPAQKDFQAEHNRPWDFDHIIPKTWMIKQGKSFGPWKGLCKEWLGTNGNFAAIPFSINRSKSDKDAWVEYEENNEKLLFDERVKTINDQLTTSEEQALKFAKICSGRSIKIYKTWRSKLASLIDEVNGIPENCKKEDCNG